MPRAASEAVAGFTLVEMLVTLAILGLATALAMNGLGGAAAGRRTALTAEAVQAEIDLLRADALRSGRRGRFAFEPQTGRFLSSRVGAVAIQAPRARVETNPTSRAGPGEIWLLPDGSSTGGRIVLAGDGASTVLTVSALTGLVRRTELR